MTRWRSRVPADLLLVLLAWLYVFPYSASVNNPNERTRVLQTIAIVEHQSLSIGEVRQSARKRWSAHDVYGEEHPFDPEEGRAFVNDTALVCDDDALKPPACAGTIYPAKAPGTALSGVPALIAGRRLGYIPGGPEGESRATWALRYGAAAPITLAGLWAVGWLLRRDGCDEALSRRVVVALGLGTTLLHYGITFVGHALASAMLVLGVVAVVMAKDRPHASGHALSVIAGLMTASAVLFEYHAVVAVACVAAWVILDPDRLRIAPGFAIGSASVLGCFAWLHQTMFGSPVKSGHFFLMSSHNRASQSAGFLGVEGPSLEVLYALLFDSYMGLASYMPWLLLLGGIGVARELSGREQQTAVPSRRLPKGATLTLTAIVMAYIAFVASLGNYRVMNGWSLGPRYLVPALLPLGVMAGRAWAWLEDRHFLVGRILTSLVAVSVVINGAVTVAMTYPPAFIQNPFGEFALPLLLDGWSVRHLGMAYDLGLAPFWTLLSIAIGWVCLGPAPPTAPRGDRALAGFVSLLLAALLAIAAAERGSTAQETIDEAQERFKPYVEGQSPDGNHPFF